VILADIVKFLAVIANVECSCYSVIAMAGKQTAQFVVLANLFVALPIGIQKCENLIVREEF